MKTIPSDGHLLSLGRELNPTSCTEHTWHQDGSNQSEKGKKNVESVMHIFPQGLCLRIYNFWTKMFILWGAYCLIYKHYSLVLLEKEISC